MLRLLLISVATIASLALLMLAEKPDDTTLVRLNGTEFHITTELIFPGGIDHEGVLLLASLPDFTRWRQGPEKPPNLSHLIYISLHTYVRSERAIQIELSSAISTYGAVKQIGQEGDVLHLITENRRLDTSMYDYYVTIGNNNEAKTFISCILPGETSNPTCSDHFMLRDIVVDINYARTNLPESDKIRTAVVALLNSFISAEPNAEKQ